MVPWDCKPEDALLHSKIRVYMYIHFLKQGTLEPDTQSVPVGNGFGASLRSPSMNGKGIGRREGFRTLDLARSTYIYPR